MSVAGHPEKNINSETELLTLHLMKNRLHQKPSIETNSSLKKLPSYLETCFRGDISCLAGMELLISFFSSCSASYYETKTFDVSGKISKRY